MIDVGCGPTIHMIIPLAPWIEEIHLADFNQENLNEIDNWLKRLPEAHNWDLYVKRVLELETGTKVTRKMIETRKSILREKIRQLVILDVSSDKNIERLPKFDLVLSSYCVDAATSQVAEWRRLIHNLTLIAAKNSTLILISSKDSKHYDVCHIRFPNAGVNQEDIIAALKESGYVLDIFNESVNYEFSIVEVPDWAAYGISSIIVVITSRSA